MYMHVCGGGSQRDHVWINLQNDTVPLPFMVICMWFILSYI